MRRSLAPMVLGIALLGLGSPAVTAAPDRLFTYEKQTTLQPGTYTLQFSLWMDPSGGTSVWTSEWVSISLKNPVLVYTLGSGTSKIPLTVDFSKQLYIQVARYGTSKPIVPREPLPGAAFAAYSLTPGPQGDPGAQGQAGLACWDLNSNNCCDIDTEDRNGSGDCTVDDCQGPQGLKGERGDAGPTGSAGLVWRGEWVVDGTYTQYDAVAFAGSAWVSLTVDNIGKQPDTNPLHWAVLAQKGAQGIQGMQGDPGPKGETGEQGATGEAGQPGPTGDAGSQGPPGMVWRGAWEETVAYTKDDVVANNGASYISLLENNSGNVPGEDPGIWSLVAALGERGEQGLSGEQGAAGVQGQQGPVGPRGDAGIVWRGAWGRETIYGVNDAVSWSGASYISLIGGNLGNDPESLTGDWALLSRRGDKGDPGPAGQCPKLCSPGDFIQCYQGPAGTLGVGVCKKGIRFCAEDGASFGPCNGVTPNTEVCNGMDDDCDGATDEGEACVERDRCAGIPNPPTINIASSSTTSSSVTLVWTAPTTNAFPPPSGSTIYNDPAGYEIWRRKDVGGSVVEDWTRRNIIADPSVLTDTDRGVSDLGDATYSYYVKAYDLCSPTPNMSAASNVYVEAYDNPCTSTPGKPSIALRTYMDHVELSWTPPVMNSTPAILPFVDGAGFQVFKWLDGIPYPAAGVPVHSTSSTATGTWSDYDTPLMKTSEYSYRVRVLDQCTSPGPRYYDSDLVVDSITNMPECTTVPHPPTNLAIDASATTVVLSWSAPAIDDPNGFVVERQNPATGTWTIIGDIPLASPQITTFSEMAPTDIATQLYRYRVWTRDLCPQLSATAVEEYEYFNPCGQAPGAPVLSSTLSTATFSTSADSTVHLVWTAPMENADGSTPLNDLAGFEVRRTKNGGPEEPVACANFTPPATVLPSTATTCDDRFTTLMMDDPTQNLRLNTYEYRIYARDTCPQPGTPSAVYADSITNCVPVTTAPVFTMPLSGTVALGSNATIKSGVMACTATPTDVLNGNIQVNLSWNAAVSGETVVYDVQRQRYFYSGSPPSDCSVVNFATSTSAETLATGLSFPMGMTPSFTHILPTADPPMPLKSSGIKYLTCYGVRARNITCSTSVKTSYSNVMPTCP